MTPPSLTIEALMQENGYPDTNWLRELVIGARDPATGQAYLDRRIPQIVASVPAEDASELQGFMGHLVSGTWIPRSILRKPF